MKIKVSLLVEEDGLGEDKQLYSGSLSKEIELVSVPCPGSFFYYEEDLPPAWISYDTSTTCASIVAHLCFYPSGVKIEGYINDILTKEAMEVLVSRGWTWTERE